MQIAFTTGACDFAFSHSLGQKRPFIFVDIQYFERPLSGKADIQELAVAEVVRNDGFAPQKRPFAYLKVCENCASRS